MLRETRAPVAQASADVRRTGKGSRFCLSWWDGVNQGGEKDPGVGRIVQTPSHFVDPSLPTVLNHPPTSSPKL